MGTTSRRFQGYCRFRNLVRVLAPLLVLQVEHTALAQAPAATVVHVAPAPAGDDANDGSELRPYLTVTKAAERAATALARGDVHILLRAGTHRPQASAPWRINVQARADARVVVRPLGGPVIIDGSDLADRIETLAIGGRHIAIENLTIRNSRYVAIGVWNGSHVRIARNSISGSCEGAVFVGGDPGQTLTDIEIASNDVFLNARKNTDSSGCPQPKPPPDGGWPGALSVLAEHDTTHISGVRIHGNRVWENWGESIVLGRTRRGADGGRNTVLGNVIRNPFSVGIYIDNGQGVRVEGNLVYSTGDERFYRQYGSVRESAAGIAVANETPDATIRAADNQIVNNVLLGTRYGIEFYVHCAPPGSVDCRIAPTGLISHLIAHNTVAHSQRAALHIETPAGQPAYHQGTRIEGNLFHAAAAAPGLAHVDANPGLTFQSNCWVGTGARVVGPGDCPYPVTSRVFVDPALPPAEPLSLAAAEGYRLHPAFAHLGQAWGAPEVLTDFAGQPRRVGQADFGAFAGAGEVPVSRRYVAQLYQDVLRRPASAAEIDAWVGQLAGGTTRASVAAAFLQSSEFSRGGLHVIRLYPAALGRDPDLAGWQFWSGALRQGTTADAVLDGILGSVEFTARQAALNDEQFVDALYRDAFGRAPDGLGREHWLARLRAGLPRREVVRAFVASAEFARSLPARALANALYLGLLGRAGEVRGVDAWAAFLQAGNSLPAAVAGFLASPEYLGRF